MLKSLAIAALLTMPAVAATHYVSAIGADTNNGTTKTTSWAHAPGMGNCASNCASYTPVAGDQIIFRGGDTWHFGAATAPAVGAGGWTHTWSGSSGNPIYIGVDQTWFAGGSWVRPILNGDNPLNTMPGVINSQVASCAHAGSINININANWVTFDNFEFVGHCWNSNTFGANTMLSEVATATPNGFLVTNNYVHGWTNTVAGQAEGGTWAHPANNNGGTVFEFNVIDGSDSDPATLNYNVGDLTTFAYNVVRYNQGQNSTSGCYRVHDNLFEHMFNVADGSGAHSDVLQCYGETSNGSGDPNLTYNNIWSNIEAMSTSGMWWFPPVGQTDYAFNNVSNNVGSGGPDNFMFNQTAGPGGGNLTMFNNTMALGSSSVIVRNDLGGGGTVTSINNHWIATPATSSEVFATPGTVTESSAIYQTDAIATGQGYTSANNYSPTLGSNSTVGAGSNQTSFCNSITDTLAKASCKSGTTNGCTYITATHSVSCPTITANARPSSGAWDVGAYSFASTCGITITSPTNLQNVSGFAGPGNASPFTFASTNSNCVGVAKVQYLIDGYNVYEPGWGTPTSSPLAGLYTYGYSLTTPFSLPYNTFWSQAGTHTATAVAYGVNGNVLATSSGVSFVIVNTWPVACSDSSAPNSSISAGSVTAGVLGVTFTISGGCSTDTIATGTFACYIDGVLYGCGLKQSPQPIQFDESVWPNGPHQVCITWGDGTNNTTYAGPLVLTNAGDPCMTVVFANGAIPMEAWGGAGSRIRMVPSATVTLNPSLINTDLSVASGVTWDYISTNTAVATINSSGVITAASACPGPASGPCSGRVYAMAESVVASDLASPAGFNGTQTAVYDIAHPFSNADIGRYIKITGGSGWNTGIYPIVAADVTLVSGTWYPVVTVTGNLVTGAASGGQFATGPTSADWVFVWPTNTIPCFGSDGVIHSNSSGYNASCIFMNSVFTGSVLASGSASSGVSGAGLNPPYSFNGGAFGRGATNAELDAGGINTLESGISSGGPCSTFTTQAAFTSSITSGFTPLNSILSTNLHTRYVYLEGDNITGSFLDPASMYNCTRGNPAGSFGVGGTPWTTPVMAVALGTIQSTLTSPAKALGMALTDEVTNPWGYHPTAGPITLGGANSWATSLTCNGTTCVIATNGQNIPTSNLNADRNFVITGSTVTGMNTVGGATYSVSSHTSNSLTFSSSATAGTYTSSNDSGWTLEPLAAQGMTFASNTDFIHSDAYVNLLRQANTLGGSRINISAPPLATDVDSTCLAVANWSGNAIDGTVSGISNFSQYFDGYPSANGGLNFITSRGPMRALVTNNQDMGFNLRNRFGCYNPTLPMTVLTNGEEKTFGLATGYTVGITNMSGNTITFSAPHGIVNVVPGETRLVITGNGTTAVNQKYLVQSVLSPTQLSVVLAGADISGTYPLSCAAPVLTFSSGYMRTPTGNSPNNLWFPSQLGNFGTNAGVGVLYGNFFTLASADPVLLTHRGETFTVTGCSAGINAPTYLYEVENPTAVTSLEYFFREVPNYSGTGGTAYITPDSSPLCGRNNCNIQTEGDPPFTMASYWEAAVNHAEGTRLYKCCESEPYYGYDPSNGFVGGGAGVHYPSTFAPTGAPSTINVGSDSFPGPHFEGNALVPVWHAASIAALHLTRWRSLLFQPELNAPDYGQRLSCSADGGTNGNIVLCWNDTNNTQTQVFKETNFVVSGQQWATELVCADGTDVFTIYSSSTTSTSSMSVGAGCAVFQLFPVTWSGFLNQPTVSLRLADISGATSVSIRWGYDLYVLDVPTSNVVNCGSSFPCTIPADRNIGTVYGRIYYTGGNGVISTSDIQTF